MIENHRQQIQMITIDYYGDDKPRSPGDPEGSGIVAKVYRTARDQDPKLSKKAYRRYRRIYMVTDASLRRLMFVLFNGGPVKLGASMMARVIAQDLKE